MNSLVLSLKCCSKCGQEKPPSEFAKGGSKQDRRGVCKACWASYMREWNAKNPEKVSARNREYKEKFPEKYRDSRLRTLFGITAKDYDEMLERQGHSCAACGTHQSKLQRKLAVDHCHSTDEVRGLLCSNCNTALGLVGDSIETLGKLINYLSKKETQS